MLNNPHSGNSIFEDPASDRKHYLEFFPFASKSQRDLRAGQTRQNGLVILTVSCRRIFLTRSPVCSVVGSLFLTDSWVCLRRTPEGRILDQTSFVIDRQLS